MLGVLASLHVMGGLCMDKELFPILKRMAAFDEDRVVLHDMVSGRKYTGSEFAALVYAMAADLRENIREEILVCEDNCAELVLLYFAGMLAGKIIIPLDPEKEDREIDRIRRLHQEAVFWERGELRRLFAQINAAVAAPNFSWQQMNAPSPGDALHEHENRTNSNSSPKNFFCTDVLLLNDE